MVDTVILLLGFVCAAIVFSLCAAEYGFLGQYSQIIYSIRKLLPNPARVHSVILAIVCFFALASSLVSHQFGSSIAPIAAQPDFMTAPNSAALTESD